MEGYKVTIESTKTELTPVERIKLKDTTDAISLDRATQENGSVTFTVTNWGVLNIHNDNAKENTDYVKYVLIDNDGNKYTTGSQAFWSAFCDIEDEMSDAGIETYAIKVYRKESKNRAGKQFLTCSVA